MTRIFTSMKVKAKTPTISINNQKGFTLIEILVAIFLMAMGAMVMLSSGSSTNEQMDKTLSNMERSIRFGADEAALRNVVVRLHFKLNLDPQEFAVEYGPNSQYIPPPLPQENTSELSGRELETYEEAQSKNSKKFNRIRELQEDSFEVYFPLKVVGVGLGQSESLVYEGEASIYIYPSAEKDPAIIILADETQIKTLTIEPYTMEFQQTTYPLNDGPEWEQVLSQAQNLFEEWKTNEQRD